MRQRITKRVVDGAAPAAKDAFVWDTDVPGFGLKITPAGRRTFILQYRLGGRSGSTKRLTLGQFGGITAEEARGEAKKLLGTGARGEDPGTTRLGERQLGITVGDALERFFRDHVRARRKS